jgi:hypothetical protein
MLVTGGSGISSGKRRMPWFVGPEERDRREGWGVRGSGGGAVAVRSQLLSCTDVTPGGFGYFAWRKWGEGEGH